MCNMVCLECCKTHWSLHCHNLIQLSDQVGRGWDMSCKVLELYVTDACQQVDST